MMPMNIFNLELMSKQNLKIEELITKRNEAKKREKF